MSKLQISTWTLKWTIYYMMLLLDLEIWSKLLFHRNLQKFKIVLMENKLNKTGSAGSTGRQKKEEKKAMHTEERCIKDNLNIEGAKLLII